MSDGRISVEVEVMDRIVPVEVFPHQIVMVPAESLNVKKVLR
jgi:hypothetical protein